MKGDWRSKDIVILKICQPEPLKLISTPVESYLQCVSLGCSFEAILNRSEFFPSDKEMHFHVLSAKNMHEVEMFFLLISEDVVQPIGISIRFSI